MGNWQVGSATQLGFLLMLMGAVCAFRPYETAKWHRNDPEAREREHKRIQSHRKKKERVEFNRGVRWAVEEPTQTAVIVFRILGALALGAGVLLTAWSLVA